MFAKHTLMVSERDPKVINSIKPVFKAEFPRKVTTWVGRDGKG